MVHALKKSFRHILVHRPIGTPTYALLPPPQPQVTISSNCGHVCLVHRPAWLWCTLNAVHIMKAVTLLNKKSSIYDEIFHIEGAEPENKLPIVNHSSTHLLILHCSSRVKRPCCPPVPAYVLSTLDFLKVTRKRDQDSN